MPPIDRGSGPTRRTPLALLVAAVVLLVVRVALGLWYEAHPEDRPNRVSWSPPPPAGQVTASGKPVLYVFTDPAQPASGRVEREVFGEPELARLIDSQFAPVLIEGGASSGTAETAALRERFGVSELPAFVVTSPDGARFRRFVGYSGAVALMDSLRGAQVELLGLPMGGGRGFHFQIGSPPPGAGDLDSLDRLPGRPAR